MKQLMVCFVIALAFTFLNSCSTLNPGAKLDDISHPETKYVVGPSEEETKVEFIGCKASDTFTGDSNWKEKLQSLGPELKASGLASDSSKFYFGVYSFQELEAYKSEKRYVSFVDVERFVYDRGLYGALSNKDYINLSLQATVYVYDTMSKRLIYSNSIRPIYRYDYFQGRLFFSDESGEIYGYYNMLISNAFLEEYESVREFLKTREASEK